MARYKSPATRRYVVRLAVLMVLYLATLFAAVKAFQAHAVSGPAAYVVAILLFLYLPVAVTVLFRMW